MKIVAELVYFPVVAVPTVAVRNAGETLMKFASSFSSLYFSRVNDLLSVIAAP